MKTLQTKRRRDASPAIRGFVYQVELTIQRWLGLSANSILELEKGEDVDTIQSAMREHGAKQKRLLEQIKARDRRLTLRSESALEALASFCEHEEANPALNLTYRYVTNAKIGLERPSPVSDKIPLVALWNRLREVSATKREYWFHLKALRQFLVAARKPSDLNPKTWKTFHGFIKRSNNAVFHSFVRKVEWLTNQTPTDLVASEIHDTLITQYSTAPDQAQTTYSVLFLHVFKVLTQRGIKRLTTAQRDAILASPTVGDADRALLLTLTTHLTDLSDRVTVLEQDVASLKTRPLPSVEEIGDACRSATKRLAEGIIDHHAVILREDLQNKLQAFLSSHTRYCFLLGPSGVGKSTSFAMEALRLSEAERIILLMPGKYFSLAEATRLITEELSRPYASLSWQNVMSALTSGPAPSSFILFIDAIDEADDLDRIAMQLTKLHDSIAAIPGERVKVVISCRDIAWSRFRQQRLTPLYETRSGAGTGRGVVEVILDDFSTRELDDALRQIGATELLESGRFGDSPSAHVSTLRDLLRHPATFEHYAALKQANSTLSSQEITWSYLVEERLRAALEKSARQCGASADILRATLVGLAALAWNAGAQNFDFDADVAEKALPEANDKKTTNSLTPLESLIENRILKESLIGGQRKLSFQINDIGAYLLSNELELQIKDLAPAQVRSKFEEWLKQSWNFQPLLDAMLALADRSFDEPYGSRSLAIVEVIVESHRFHDGLIFGLMRPQVIKTIFDIVGRANENAFYDYRDAALQVRPFPGTLEEIRSHLQDDYRFTRRLAAELAGAHHDEISITQLIQLLRDEDHDVRERAYKAFGHIGKAAISQLIKTIRERSTSVDLKNSCIHALRNIGELNRDISAVLSKVLKKGRHNQALLRSTFLTAAHLRDRGHAQFASSVLKDHDSDIVQSAAKYLAEVPDATAYSALLSALNPSHPSREHSWNLSQLMMALLRADRVKARKDLREIYQKALAGQHELTSSEAIHISERFDVPDLQPLILARLIEQLRLGSEGRIVWESARVIGTTWRIDQLNCLVKSTGEFEKQGTDLARLFVDATIPGIQESEEFRLGDRLNRTSDLIPVVKCQSVNFTKEAARLLRHSGVLSCIDLCRWLWVLGDTRAEAALIHRFQNPSERREAIHERSYAVRALATCGEAKGTHVVMDYLRNRGKEIDLHFAEETLYPLLMRKMIGANELIKVAQDPKLNWWSRSVSLIALSNTRAHKLNDLLVDVAVSTNNNPRLQAQAARLLALEKKASIIPKLRSLLRNSDNTAVKEEAAEGLAHLKDTASVHEIERALEHQDKPGFASALSQFAEESSLPILLRRLASANHQTQWAYLNALGAFWKYPDGRAAILEQVDKWSSYEERYLNNQSALIAGLCLHEPDVILDQFNKSFDDGHVTVAARETMALWMGRLFNRKTADGTLLLETAKRLVCDKHVPAREMAVHTLRYGEKRFCEELFRQLYDSTHGTGWERASAAYTLGFWNSPGRLIQDARFDGAWLVRRAGDAALAIREKRQHLSKHLNMVESGKGLQRLSSYLCLSERGDQTTVWQMHDDDRMTGIAQAFRRRLTARINTRLTSEYKEKQEEENKLDESRGEIWFD